jgi:hypothetical protein
MTLNKEKLQDKESPEAKAEEALLRLGVQPIPENIRAAIDLQNTWQHPEGFEDIVESDSLEGIARQMKKKNVKQVSHIEGPKLWIHCKLAIKLAEFLPISEEKKTDLKLIMLYHDLGKTTPGIEDRYENRQTLKKARAEGKLYQPARGHALEQGERIEEGFKANGISGRKLEVFMTVVRNHMETSISEMTGPKLVKMFERFGKTDEEKKETAELIAFAIQLDRNANAGLGFNDEGELENPKKENRTGEEFDKIWAKYEEAKNLNNN